MTVTYPADLFQQALDNVRANQWYTGYTIEELAHWESRIVVHYAGPVGPFCYIEEPADNPIVNEMARINLLRVSNLTSDPSLSFLR